MFRCVGWKFGPPDTNVPFWSDTTYPESVVPLGHVNPVPQEMVTVLPAIGSPVMVGVSVGVGRAARAA